MTFPALPAQGSASWYAWAQAVHNAATNTEYVVAPTGVAATDTANIQAAINTVPNGGLVMLDGGTYVTNATITLPNGVHLRGQSAPGSVLSYTGTGIAIQHSPATADYGTRAGLHDVQIIGTSAAGATGVEVSDAYGFGFERVVVRDFTAGCGVRLHNKLRWTEGTYAEDLAVRNCATGIAFNRTASSGASNSFGHTDFLRVSINVPASGTGFYVGETTDACLIYDSILNVVMWVASGGTGYKIGAGSTVNQSIVNWHGELESGATGVTGVNNAGTVTVIGRYAEGFGTSNTFGAFKVLPMLRSQDWAQGADGSGYTYHQALTNSPDTNHDATFGFYEASGISSPYVSMYEGAGNALKVLRVNFGTKVTAGTTAQLMLLDKDGHMWVMSTIGTGSGATASRPSASTVGAASMWYDTTLHKPIWSDGTSWRDATGTVV